jgi:tRNA threonylcarbamoyladenosine biosynthesis protein TsaB
LRTLVLDLSASLYLGIVDAGGKVLASRIREDARGETAHGLLDEALAEAGIGPGELDAVAVGAGPGSFTGIRVAMAMAQGLCFARRLPLHPFSSLEALRACVPGAPGRRAVAAIAANAGRYYASLGDPPREALVTAAELLERAVTDEAFIHSGPLPDRERLAAAFPALIRLEEAMDFARVAALALAREPARDGVIRPNYLMASAAEEKRRAALPAAEGGDGASAGKPADGPGPGG